MSKSKPYRLLIRPLTESKAKFLRIFPLRKKSFVEGEKLRVSFELENISEKDFLEECFTSALVAFSTRG
jgi:hypothetical protein